MQSTRDSYWMGQALELARSALFTTSPNPRVGCVIVSPGGQLIGRGCTQQVGGSHAEIVALQDASQGGHSVVGATVYVTLEPCAHQGRTGPCCDALIQARVARVVGALVDPNPVVGGLGFARLRAAGVNVHIGPGANEARELNIGFLSRMVRGTPWVRLKVAASLDGTTALLNGNSQWITSAEARRDGHAWRARACAILTGIGTVLDDDPRLDVREVVTPRQPDVVVVDSQLQLGADAALLNATRNRYVYSATHDSAGRAALESRGVQITCLPNAAGKVDLAALLQDLGRKGVNELHVEAGHKLNGSLLREGLVDELLVYLAPRMLGAGLGMAQLGPLDSLPDGLSLSFRSIDVLGGDLRLVARVVGRDQF